MPVSETASPGSAGPVPSSGAGAAQRRHRSPGGAEPAQSARGANQRRLAEPAQSARVAVSLYTDGYQVNGQESHCSIQTKPK